MFGSMAREQELVTCSKPLESVPQYVCLDKLLTGGPDREKDVYRRKKEWVGAPMVGMSKP